MKKVLVITYYWPPAGGGGVQRWLKFSKYIRDGGWEPVIYTAEGGEMALQDDSLLEEVPEGTVVIKQPIWEPYYFYKKLTGKKKGEKVYSGFITEKKKAGPGQRLSIWIRGNFFIPDARKFWIKPSIKFLVKYLKDHKVDAILSNGPPHSMHMIALGLKEKLGLPWLADFRDPWTNIDFYDQLMLSKRADRKHKRLEQKVLTTADKVVTVSWSWAEDFKKLCGREIEVITNGYDEADFEGGEPALSKSFSLTHVGSLNKDRNPKSLWKVLERICDSNPQFKEDLEIILIGPTDFEAINDINQSGLESNLKLIDHLPHRAAIDKLRESQVLLLPINDTPNVSGVIPGKLYEYLGARRPILCIGPDKGDSARIIKETNAGKVAGFDDINEIQKILLEYFVQYQSKILNIGSYGIDKFSRKSLAVKMCEQLDKISR